jgi:hypothetical protein
MVVVGGERGCLYLEGLKNEERHNTGTRRIERVKWKGGVRGEKKEIFIHESMNCRGDRAGHQEKGGCCVLRSTVYVQSPSPIFFFRRWSRNGQTDALPLNRTMILPGEY